MEVIQLNATARTGLGKTASKSARKDNLVPCVLYGGKEVKHFMVAPLDLRPLVYSPEFKVVEVTLDGQAHRCILKDVQFHPVTESILHIDFLRLQESHPVKVEIPIHFEGAAVGLKAGGKLIKKMRKVKIKTTPEHLIDKIILDTTNMELGQSQRIKDLAKSKGVEVLNDVNSPVASIEVPRALRTGEAEATPAAGTPAATPAAGATPAAPAAGKAAPAKEKEAPAKGGKK